MMKTAGLVLHRLKYSDSSFILKCFTQQLGNVPVFFWQGKKRGQIMDHHFYELSLDKKPGRDLYNLKEQHYLQEFNPTITNANTPLWLLVNELTLKTTAENVPLPNLFSLLVKFRSLLTEPQQEQEFLVVILIAFSEQLGILHARDVPTINQHQKELLSLLNVNLPPALPDNTGSSHALLEHLIAHFDIAHLYSADLIL